MTLGSLQQALTKEPSTQQRMHMERIGEAIELLRLYMHEAEGSTLPGEHQEHQWSTRRMALAATYLEIAEMLAIRAAVE